jgi:hypothetical protein
MEADRNSFKILDPKSVITTFSALCQAPLSLLWLVIQPIPRQWKCFCSLRIFQNVFWFDSAEARFLAGSPLTCHDFCAPPHLRYEDG